MAISVRFVQNIPNHSPSKSETQQSSDQRVVAVLPTGSCCSFCRNRLQQVQIKIDLKYLKTSEKLTKFIFEKFRKFPFQQVYIKGVNSSNILAYYAVYKNYYAAGIQNLLLITFKIVGSNY